MYICKPFVYQDLYQLNHGKKSANLWKVLTRSEKLYYIFWKGVFVYIAVWKNYYYNANKVYIEKLLISDKDDHIKREKWGLKCTEVGANVNEKFNMP